MYLILSYPRWKQQAIEKFKEGAGPNDINCSRCDGVGLELCETCKHELGECGHCGGAGFMDYTEASEQDLNAHFNERLYCQKVVEVIHLLAHHTGRDFLSLAGHFMAQFRQGVHREDNIYV
ncbi:MAG: hypothetical protein OQJ95_06520 [Kangiella sp.]|nr:hypothetical protein [Kangiella sp.]MCW9029235.1 hypothetical protein [Kangiella sp.]